MARLVNLLTASIATCVVATGIGFGVFAEAVRRLEPVEEARADGIVVLTGDEARISTGMRLMLDGRARRMLISGVHPATKMPSELKLRLRRNEAHREALLKCCIDIGHEALNTSGNADEARQWVREHGFRSLIVVTSAYHMPRSLTELERTMPGTTFIPFPVVSSRVLRPDAWWRHWPTTRLLAGEYVKLLGAYARSRLLRLMSVDEGGQMPRPLPTDTSLSARGEVAR